MLTESLSSQKLICDPAKGLEPEDIKGALERAKAGIIGAFTSIASSLWKGLKVIFIPVRQEVDHFHGKDYRSMDQKLADAKLEFCMRYPTIPWL